MPTLEDIRNAFNSGRVRWRLHAQERMFERGIWREDVTEIVVRGEIIEAYGSDKPFPSFLIHGYTNEQVLHVLIGWDEKNRMAYVVTAYVPDEIHFESDLKTRKARSW